MILEDKPQKECKIWSSQRLMKVERKIFKYPRRRRNVNPPDRMKQGAILPVWPHTSRRQVQAFPD